MERQSVGSQTSDATWELIIQPQSLFCPNLLLPVYCNWHIFYRKLPCPWEGCGFKTFQRRDLMTHYRGQCVYYSSYFPSHWCILLLAREYLFVLMTRTPALAHFEHVILPLFSDTGNTFTTTSKHLRPPTVPRPEIPFPLCVFPLGKVWPW